jgi:TIR domain
MSAPIFISHAAEDKDEVAAPLYEALCKFGISVWYDDAVIELGDSIRRMIDSGLAKCTYGVVVLSPHFLAKEWPQRELDGLFARETASGEKAILPVWHNLSPADLVVYSPLLADRLAVKTSLGISAVAEKIAEVVSRRRDRS